MSLLFTTILFFFFLITTVSPTAHLRLDMTASNECAIRLIANILHSESFWLQGGAQRTTSFHPLAQHEHSITVTYSIDGGSPQERVYEMRKAGTTRREVLTFGEIAVLVEATVECDDGFHGSRCHKPIGSRVKTTVTTVTTVTTSTTVTSDTPSTPEVSTSSEASTTPEVISPNSIIIALSLITILLTLLAILLILCFFNRRRHRNIYIQPTVFTPQTPTDISLDSGIESSPGYTSKQFNC
ncbi:hypothetical protein GCK72_016961 [Caenorhabditis remanei]|uniref:Uncharacterized protein n=1 Tax=Caenorhabditis remanei TaxID=31234 RepID=A0A6A5G6R5_CAERE|nr:hypothetical protein GCK72_016961 [Caenorhabditis remanei]KAF1750411.1 hypothetical protein GCK72_016961 [Caenorhabditis remanei]